MFLLDYEIRICFRMPMRQHRQKMEQIKSEATEALEQYLVWETKKKGIFQTDGK